MRSSCAGFTLIEMLAVLAILAMASMAGATMTRPNPKLLSLETEALRLASGLRAARSAALVRNGQASLWIDLDAKTYGLQHDKALGRFPSDANLVLYSASSERFRETVGAIRFFEDGSSSGGKLEISDNNRRIAVIVDWLTGTTRIEKPSMHASELQRIHAR